MARGGWKSNFTMNNVYNHALKEKANEFDIKIPEHFKEVAKKRECFLKKANKSRV